MQAAQAAQGAAAPSQPTDYRIITAQLAVIGAYRGRDERSHAFDYFLLACYDPDTNQFQSTCRVGIGLPEEVRDAITAEIAPLVLQHRPPNYLCGLAIEPDAWLAVGKVWEVHAGALSVLAAHRAAVGRLHEEYGLGMQFPRFVREVQRAGIEAVTTAAQMIAMYNEQAERRRQQDELQRQQQDQQQQEQQQQLQQQQQEAQHEVELDGQ